MLPKFCWLSYKVCGEKSLNCNSTAMTAMGDPALGKALTDMNILLYSHMVLPTKSTLSTVQYVLFHSIILTYMSHQLLGLQTILCLVFLSIFQLHLRCLFQKNNFFLKSWFGICVFLSLVLHLPQFWILPQVVWP